MLKKKAHLPEAGVGFIDLVALASNIALNLSFPIALITWLQKKNTFTCLEFQPPKHPQQDA
jgi:hypothetical protein